MRKRTKTRTFDYSPQALRALTRHKMPPPTKAFKDLKKHGRKSFCRAKIDKEL